MRQVIENSRTGAISTPEVPIPRRPPGMLLVHNRASLISAGTEAAAIKFGEKNLVQKARGRPDLVKQVIGKVASDGMLATYQTVRARLDLPVALGYSCAGVVLEADALTPRLKVGDRVACAGANYASHAEVVVIPRNLTAPIPDGVTFEDAAFSTVGAVALQGLRVGDVRVGERVVVIGLGLVGLLTVQLLKAAGCLVLGTDLNSDRAELARELGANEAHALDVQRVVEAVDRFTAGRGADAVLITAATKSSGPIELAGELSRLKGRVVAIGDVGMNVPRQSYYEKELDLRLSRSYGPGRYDPMYEEKGIDYPYAYVPFTEQRNLETFLSLVAEGKVTPSRLITHRFALEEAPHAYALIKGEAGEPSLGIIFTYPENAPVNRTVVIDANGAAAPEALIRVGVIGAGAYARQMLLPHLKASKDLDLVGVSASRGISAADTARRFGFRYAATDSAEVLGDPAINLVVIATRHDSHAALAEAALRNGKHVFVEKPLATNENDLRRVVAAAEETKRSLVVGFNRRFAPLTQRAKAKFQNHTQPLAMFYRINAGAVPLMHWSQDAEEGGGRIIGEVCHFVDLLQFLCGAPPIAVSATAVNGDTGSIPPEDIITIALRFADGSIGAIHYFANGDRAIPKERLEVYGGGRTFILEDFRRARYAEGGHVAKWGGRIQNKGQSEQLEALTSALRSGGSSPIPLRDAVITTLTTFRILDSLRLAREVPIGWSEDSGEDHRLTDSEG
ncbi:MAG TPA: bi-domain-containing oxidoreductase [Armatimonadota bacterium]|nr:bi-domain-containing oxidoreductase [Armatimonadota bacterium]